ncbi:hypothetical protein ACFVAJ_17875 [Agromyces sp. NPDC057679]|uniref:hypothetical protein n=1 Tax=Agromyces sp. NPDC057679 TaxID=3346207 RepID=UPI00366B4ABF
MPEIYEPSDAAVAAYPYLESAPRGLVLVFQEVFDRGAAEGHKVPAEEAFPDGSGQIMILLAYREAYEKGAAHAAREAQRG